MPRLFEKKNCDCDRHKNEIRKWEMVRVCVGRGRREKERRAEGLIVGLRKATKHIQHRHTHTCTHKHSPPDNNSLQSHSSLYVVAYFILILCVSNQNQLVPWWHNLLPSPLLCHVSHQENRAPLSWDYQLSEVKDDVIIYFFLVHWTQYLYVTWWIIKQRETKEKGWITDHFSTLVPSENISDYS